MALDRFQITGAPTCRVVYPKGLFEKTVVKGTNSEPKYNCVILVPKSDKAKIDQVDARFMEAFQELRDKKFTGKTPAAIESKNNCWKDGDEMADKDEKYEAFRGYKVLSVASRNVRPLVSDKQRRTITNGVPVPGLSVDQMSPEELNDGDYILCNVSFWTYNKAAAGIGGNVHAIVRVADGERIAGASTNVDDYINMDDLGDFQ